MDVVKVCPSKESLISSKVSFSNFLKDEFPPSFSEYLQQKIREKFINIADPEKCGLPKVLVQHKQKISLKYTEISFIPLSLF